jgi:hypothetical protein
MDQEQMRVAATKAVNDLDENASRKLAFIAALAGWTDVVRDATVRAVLVGRIQEAKETNPDLVFMCHLCGMLELAAAHDAGDLDGVTMTDLGNPYDPKPRS